MNLLAALANAPLFRQPPLAIAVNVTVFLCFLLVVLAVVADFRAYHRRSDVVASRRSLVETGSMTAFFLVYYLVIRLRLLELVPPGWWRTASIVAGLLLMVAGAVMNVLGRWYLKSNWANQIKIYRDHWLVTTGPFALVRHPLYASLIWMLVGGAFVYANLAGFVLTIAMFVPMMYLRARQEERMLMATFGEQYSEYRRVTGLFAPRLPR